MSSTHNAFRIHGMGPCALQEPDCVGTAPKVAGSVLQALAASSLMLKPKGIASEFFGFTGEDAFGSQLRRALLHLPLDLSHFRRYPGPSPRIQMGADRSRVGSAPLQFLLERSRDIADWPEAAFTQATWIWIETPPDDPWCESVLSVLDRARRRQAFTGVWLTSGDLDAFPYAKRQTGWAALCDVVLVDETEEASPIADGKRLQPNLAWLSEVPTWIRMQPRSIEFGSRGGIFGRCEGRMTMPAGWSKGLTMGAFMAHLMHEVFQEDDFLRVDVHVNRERLGMQPLHLGKALEWGVLAGTLALESESGIAAETEKGSWLKRVNQAWRNRYPERFAIWGGRRETQR